MIVKKAERTVDEKLAPNGAGLFCKDKLLDVPGVSKKVRMFAHVKLEPGAAVEHHTHEGESETFYILSGTAEYNDNGMIYRVTDGDVTFCPSGQGHGIKNVGKDDLHFIGLIVLD